MIEALIIHGLFVLALAYLGWRLLGRGRAGGCGGCPSCPVKAASSKTHRPVVAVTIGVTTAKR